MGGDVMKHDNERDSTTTEDVSPSRQKKKHFPSTLVFVYKEKNLINEGGMEIMRRHETRVIIAQVEAS